MTAKQRTEPHRPISEQIQDPNSPLVLDALERTCDQCRADIGQLCAKRGGIHQDLLGRLVHLGRLSPP